MLRQALNSPAMRKRARQFGRLVRHSAITPRKGESHKPVLVADESMGITFIGLAFHHHRRHHELFGDTDEHKTRHGRAAH